MIRDKFSQIKKEAEVCQFEAYSITGRLIQFPLYLRDMKFPFDLKIEGPLSSWSVQIQRVGTDYLEINYQGDGKCSAIFEWRVDGRRFPKIVVSDALRWSNLVEGSQIMELKMAEIPEHSQLLESLSRENFQVENLKSLQHTEFRCLIARELRNS